MGRRPDYEAETLKLYRCPARRSAALARLDNLGISSIWREAAIGEGLQTRRRRLGSVLINDDEEVSVSAMMNVSCTRPRAGG
jgi:hypothetical protein